MALWCFCSLHIFRNGETRNFNFLVKFDLESHNRFPPPPPPHQKKKLDFNQGILHLWSKFGYCSEWMTDTGNDNTQRPKLASSNKTRSGWLQSSLGSPLLGEKYTQSKVKVMAGVIGQSHYYRLSSYSGFNNLKLVDKMCENEIDPVNIFITMTS